MSEVCHLDITEVHNDFLMLLLILDRIVSLKSRAHIFTNNKVDCIVSLKSRAHIFTNNKDALQMTRRLC
jgi:hypothetical protein